MSISPWYQRKEGHASHIVYLDKKGKELEKLVSKEKTMIIRGAAGKKVSLGGRVKVGDELYFVETGGHQIVTHMAVVTNVIETDKMTQEESIAFVDQYERWAGKKFICLIEVLEIMEIEAFKYQRDSNMDDWIITGDINEVKEHEL